MGLAYRGDIGRLRAAIARLHATGNLKVSVVGGSISAGAGALDAHRWVLCRGVCVCVYGTV